MNTKDGLIRIIGRNTYYAPPHRHTFAPPRAVWIRGYLCKVRSKEDLSHCTMNEIPLTEPLRQTLFQTPLFDGAPTSLLASLTERLDARLYALEKNDVIARQGAACRALYVLLKGRVRVDIIDAWGNRVMIEAIVAPRSFATPHLFSRDQTLPATFTATTPSTLLMAPRESLFRLISEEPYLLKNFLHVSGNCNHCTSSRLRILTQRTVRNRFVAYLLEHRPGTDSWIAAEHNTSQLAHYLCVTRPALSKEISKMVREGLIAVDGRRFRLLAEQQLRQEMG